MGIEDALSNEGRCAKCKEVMFIARPDKLPLCTKCTEEFTAKFAKIRPEKVTDKTYLRGEGKTEQDDY